MAPHYLDHRPGRQLRSDAGNVDGTGATRLTNNPAPEFFPECLAEYGTRIAFTSQRNGNEEIYVMNADGTDPVADE